jgi:hypothetical protein
MYRFGCSYFIYHHIEQTILIIHITIPLKCNSSGVEVSACLNAYNGSENNVLHNLNLFVHNSSALAECLIASVIWPGGLLHSKSCVYSVLITN